MDNSEGVDEEALKRILGLAEEGQWSEVANQLRALLEAAPEDPRLLCWLGVAELELGLESLAYERFRRALLAEPTDPTLLTTAGSALAQIDDPAAESALRSAALLGPDVAVSRLYYGAYLTREGMFDDALVELSAALQLDPEDALIQREIGTLLAFKGRREQAIESYEAAIRIDPQDGLSHVLMGLELLEHDATEPAAVALMEGARLVPHDIGAQLLAALSAQAAGFSDAAAEFVERARLIATPEDLEVIRDVEDAMEEEHDEVEEMLTDLASSEVRLRRAVRP